MGCVAALFYKSEGPSVLIAACGSSYRTWSRAGPAPAITLALDLIQTASRPMRFSLFALLALCWTQSANAFDLTTQNLVLSGYVTSKVTSAPFDRKLIRATQDDAAVFIASDGQIRGAQLESALRYLRQHPPTFSASDLELAQAILVQ